MMEALPSPSISSLSTFGINEGLPINCVISTIIDKKGRLWIEFCEYLKEDEINDFFHYDGKKSFFHPLALDSLKTIEKNLKWYQIGSTKTGYLFGSALEHPLTFLLNPDTKKQYIFQFNPKERVLKAVEDPQEGILVLTWDSTTSRIYRLNEEGKKEILGEFKNNSGNESNLMFSRSLIIQDNKAWIFIPFEGLAGIDLSTKEKVFYSFQDLFNKTLQFENVHEFGLRQGELSISILNSDNLLLYLGPYHGFYTFHIPSLEVRPHHTLNRFIDPLPEKSNLSIWIKRDNVNNLFLTFKSISSSQNIIQARDLFHILMDNKGQLYNYSALINEMKNFAQLERGSKWEGDFYSQDFKRQLIWTSYGGLIFADLQIKTEGIKVYPISTGVRAIDALDSNTLFFNTDSWDGTLNLPEGKDSPLPHDNFKSSTFSSLHISEDQNLWMTNGTYFIQYNWKNDKIDSLHVGIDFNKFTFINKEEILLLSHKGELFHYHLIDQKVRPFIYKDVPFSVESEVNDLYYSKEEKLWVAAKNGLWQIDLQNKEVSSYNSTTGLPDNYIMSIHPGENGKLWLGTYSSGVLILDSSTNEVKQISVIDGLSHKTVTGILSDEQGNRWVGTYNGITILSSTGKVLFDLSDKDGLINNEFNRTSYFKFPDGRMAFGGIEGITVLDPTLLRKSFIDNSPLHIFLTSLTYYDKKEAKNQTLIGALTPKKPINIPAANRFLKLDFAISEYVDLTKHTYSYRIIPKKMKENAVESIAWSNLGPVSELTLNNLPVGDYIIQIQGVDHKGRRALTPIEISIHVEQFFYRTWWFYALCALPFILGTWIWMRRVLTERKRLKIEVEKRTKQIRLDKEIIAQQVEELQQFDQAKSRFFANISHELRTPLTIILGMIDQVEKQPKRWLERGAKMIRNNGSNLLDLVNQILELQKLESGNLTVNLQLDDIIPFLRSIFDQFKALGASKNLQMEFLPEMETLTMDFDPEKILRIASNLLSNAIKYTPENGAINFSVSSGKINKESPGDHLILRVEDTGRGIHHEELPYIFDRFFQATTQEKTSSGGTGIGLSLTQELVKLLKGKIEVVSQLGQGTTFQVFLPITQNAKPGQNKDLMSIQAAVLGTQGPPKKGIIDEKDLPLALIVEDNADIAQYLQICLEGSYRMHFAKNGQEGIDQALDQIPDIIVSDVMMPEKNGFELCEALKEDIRTSHIPIVLLTAKSDVESRIVGLKQGADDYLAKPFHEEELLIRLKNLLDIRLKLQKRYQNLYDQAPIEEKSVVSKEDEFILKFKEIVEAQLSDPDFDVDHLSQALFLSRSHLSRKIKALTGRSLSIYIRSLRLQKARHLLLSTNLSIKEISYEVGIFNPPYFTRAYQEEFGETPSNTREIQ